MKKILVVLFPIILFIFIRMCIKYETKSFYYIYSNSKNLYEERLKDIYLSKDEIKFITFGEIDKNLILKKIFLIYKNLELGEVIIDRKIEEILTKNPYYISDDIIKILGNDYNKIRESKEEYLQDKEFKIIVVLENTSKNKLYEIIFENVNLYYRKKGFDIFIPNI